MLHIPEVSVGLPLISGKKVFSSPVGSKTRTSPDLQIHMFRHFEVCCRDLVVMFLFPGELRKYWSLDPELQLRGFE